MRFLILVMKQKVLLIQLFQMLSVLLGIFGQDQFLIEGFHTPLRFDHNKNRGGILVFFQEDIPAKILSHDFPSAGSLFLEIILHKKKCLINCSYIPNNNNIKNHLEIIRKPLDAFSIKQINSLIKQPACFKNPEKPSFIDLILTNKPQSFQSTCVIEAGLSDFYRITRSVLKTHFRKLPPKIVR